MADAWAAAFAALSFAELACLWGVMRFHFNEREGWNRERNALIERLVPGSTPPEEQSPVRHYILGDDEAEWRASLDPETRAQMEFAERNGVMG